MKTRGVNLIILIGFFMLFFGSANLWAEEESPSASADVAILSKYVWRGQELSRDSIVIQPSMTISYKGFSGNLWGNAEYGLLRQAFHPRIRRCGPLWEEKAISAENLP
jgi:hypothetical protein